MDPGMVLGVSRKRTANWPRHAFSSNADTIAVRRGLPDPAGGPLRLLLPGVESEADPGRSGRRRGGVRRLVGRPGARAGPGAGALHGGHTQQRFSGEAMCCISFERRDAGTVAQYYRK